MAEQFVFSVFNEELIASDERFIRFSGNPGLFFKVGKLIDGGQERTFALIFDPNKGWTEESARDGYFQGGNVSMMKEDLDLPNYRNREMEKAIV